MERIQIEVTVDSGFPRMAANPSYLQNPVDAGIGIGYISTKLNSRSWACSL